MKQNKLKKFFTLQKHADGGFTLVELIIVIAILAILAGAAVPAYNGYTQKAREAADQMIVAAANDAFAAACMENKVDAMNVTEASISVLEGKVYGLSSAKTAADAKFVDKAAPYFLTYYAGNENMTFQTPGINSLIWNDTLDSFEMSKAACAARIVLEDGRVVNISAEDMAAILSSTYADMGYGGVKATLDRVSKSGAMLAKICGAVPIDFSGNTLVNKLTAAMAAYGIIDNEKQAEMNANLKASNNGFWASDEQKAAYTQATKEAENGLAMVTAKYLASGGNVDELIAVDLGNSFTGVITPMATGTGGTKTVSAIAVQYALATGFANSDAGQGTFDELGGKTVNEYLESSEDPVEAINTVKNLDAYKNNYVGTDQYNNDKNGFVATMSILGDNVGTVNPNGTVKEEGIINPDEYLSTGAGGEDVEDILTGVLGE